MQIELDPHPEAQQQKIISSSATQCTRVFGQSSKVEALIWNPNATANWSLLFTPAFGSYLQYLNWKELGEEDRANTSRIWFMVSICLYLIIPFISLAANSPDASANVGRGIGFWYLIIWYFSHGRSQAKFIKEHYENSYSRKSWGQPLLIAFAAVIGYFILAFSIGVVISLLRH